MKIRFLSPSQLLNGLQCRLEFQGHETIEELSPDYEDVVIEEAKKIPHAVCDSLGYKLVSSKPDYHISKFWNSTSWSPETLLSFPIEQLLPGDLGPCGSNGAVAKRCEKPLFEKLFFQPALQEFLKLSGERAGFVTLGMDKTEVVDLHMGIPGFGLYCFCQMAKGPLVDYLVSEPKMPSAWMSALVLSRWPYPERGEREPLRVEVDSRAFPHFWPWARPEWFSGNSFQTVDTLIGVATSYGATLEDSLWYAEATCRSVQMGRKMYYRDGVWELRKRIELAMHAVDHFSV